MPDPTSAGGTGSAYFSVFHPPARRSAVVVEVPHAGLLLDGPSLARLIAPARSLGRDADLLVEELYSEAPRLGASMLVAHVSRYVCDLNRSEMDVDALAAMGGTAEASPHGMIWRSTTEDRPALAAPIPSAELERRRTEIYRPYHDALHRLIRSKLDEFGFAVLLCAHSMPSFGRHLSSTGDRPRADVVPGTRGGSSASPRVLAVVDQVADRHQLSIVHDDPYRGGFSTAHYGQPKSGVHAIQVELARRNYMDEAGLCRLPDRFEKTRAFCNDLVSELGALDLG